MIQEQVLETTGHEDWPMIRCLGGVGMVCALLIVLTWQITLPIIEAKKAIYLEGAVYRALPGAVQAQTFAVDANQQIAPLSEISEPVARFHAGYNADGKLIGIALEAEGQGFQDVIRILYGYDPVKQIVIGFQVLESRETPGLGDKIEKDPIFLENFTALDVTLSEGEGAAPIHPIVMVAKGSKTEAWQIDAISGATITSRAVADILREHTTQWLPLIHSSRNLFQEPTP